MKTFLWIEHILRMGALSARPRNQIKPGRWTFGIAPIDVRIAGFIFHQWIRNLKSPGQIN
jgi:hypothetical protein